jgi:hypothetical protein
VGRPSGSADRIHTANDDEQLVLLPTQNLNARYMKSEYSRDRSTTKERQASTELNSLIARDSTTDFAAASQQQLSSPFAALQLLALAATQQLTVLNMIPNYFPSLDTLKGTSLRKFASIEAYVLFRAVEVQKNKKTGKHAFLG